jgi:hypothetical protein
MRSRLPRRLVRLRGRLQVWLVRLQVWLRVRLQVWLRVRLQVWLRVRLQVWLRVRLQMWLRVRRRLRRRPALCLLRDADVRQRRLEPERFRFECPRDEACEERHDHTPAEHVDAPGHRHVDVVRCFDAGADGDHRAGAAGGEQREQHRRECDATAPLADLGRGEQDEHGEQRRERRRTERSVTGELHFLRDRNGLAGTIAPDVAAGRAERTDADVLGRDLLAVDNGVAGPERRRGDRDHECRRRCEREERAEGA